MTAKGKRRTLKKEWVPLIFASIWIGEGGFMTRGDDKGAPFPSP